MQMDEKEVTVTIFITIHGLCNIEPGDMGGNLNFEKNEKELKSIILKFEILTLIVQYTYYLLV